MGNVLAVQGFVSCHDSNDTADSNFSAGLGDGIVGWMGAWQGSGTLPGYFPSALPGWDNGRRQGIFSALRVCDTA